jgi:hypothetical protein
VFPLTPKGKISRITLHETPFNPAMTLKEETMKRPSLTILLAAFALGFGAPVARALEVAPDIARQGESGVASSVRSTPDVDPSRRLPAAAQTVPDSVFATGSALPEARREEFGGLSTESVLRSPLTQPGCVICLEGSSSVQWTGTTGSYHVDGIGNNRSSGTSGSLDLRIALSSSLPVFGNTITYYTFTDYLTLSPLAAGFHYTNVNSGTVNFFPSSIPAGQYWMFLYLREYQGGGVYTYTDFALMNNKATCNGVSCATVATCTEDAFTMCLAGGRYRITSHWQNQYAGGATATLSKARITDYTGAFWIQDSSTYEYMIRLQTGQSNGRTWVAIPTFTDVEFWITVTDTFNGQSKDYHSAPGNRTLIYDPFFFVYP